MKKAAERLTISDLERFPIWDFINDDDSGETRVKAVDKVPVETLSGKLVGTKVKFANGAEHWAILGNIDSENYRQTKQFLTISVFIKDAIFHLARYHDPDFIGAGPMALANFARMRIGEIFPIHYDLTQVSSGDPKVLVGKIEFEPEEKLTQEELIKLAVMEGGSS